MANMQFGLMMRAQFPGDDMQRASGDVGASAAR